GRRRGGADRGRQERRDPDPPQRRHRGRPAHRSDQRTAARAQGAVRAHASLRLRTRGPAVRGCSSSRAPATTAPQAFWAAAALRLARAITRRAERRCVTLERAGGLPNPDLRRWLNRLSLLLFVLGRYEESVAGKRPVPARRAGPERSS